MRQGGESEAQDRLLKPGSGVLADAPINKPHSFNQTWVLFTYHQICDEDIAVRRIANKLEWIAGS